MQTFTILLSHRSWSTASCAHRFHSRNGPLAVDNIMLFLFTTFMKRQSFYMGIGSYKMRIEQINYCNKLKRHSASNIYCVYSYGNGAGFTLLFFFATVLFFSVFWCLGFSGRGLLRIVEYEQNKWAFTYTHSVQHINFPTIPAEGEILRNIFTPFLFSSAALFHHLLALASIVIGFTHISMTTFHHIRYIQPWVNCCDLCI